MRKDLSQSQIIMWTSLTSSVEHFEDFLKTCSADNFRFFLKTYILSPRTVPEWLETYVTNHLHTVKSSFLIDNIDLVMQVLPEIHYSYFLEMIMEAEAWDKLNRTLAYFPSWTLKPLLMVGPEIGIHLNWGLWQNTTEKAKLLSEAGFEHDTLPWFPIIDFKGWLDISEYPTDNYRYRTYTEKCNFNPGSLVDSKLQVYANKFPGGIPVTFNVVDCVLVREKHPCYDIPYVRVCRCELALFLKVRKTELSTDEEEPAPKRLPIENDSDSDKGTVNTSIKFVGKDSFYRIDFNEEEPIKNGSDTFQEIPQSTLLELSTDADEPIKNDSDTDSNEEEPIENDSNDENNPDDNNDHCPSVTTDTDTDGTDSSDDTVVIYNEEKPVNKGIFSWFGF